MTLTSFWITIFIAEVQKKQEHCSWSVQGASFLLVFYSNSLGTGIEYTEPHSIPCIFYPVMYRVLRQVPFPPSYSVPPLHPLFNYFPIFLQFLRYPSFIYHPLYVRDLTFSLSFSPFEGFLCRADYTVCTVRYIRGDSCISCTEFPQHPSWTQFSRY